jgi:hypothetical protein
MRKIQVFKAYQAPKKLTLPEKSRKQKVALDKKLKKNSKDFEKALFKLSESRF